MTALTRFALASLLLTPLLAIAEEDDDVRTPAIAPDAPAEAKPTRRARPADEDSAAKETLLKTEERSSPPTGGGQGPQHSEEPRKKKAAPAAAEAVDASLASSVFSPEGVEVREDQSIFALFALLNASGYDDAPITRALPVPHRSYSAIRDDARRKLAAANVDGALFDATPRSPAALALELAAGHAPAGLAETAKTAGVDALYTAALPSVRTDLKRYAAAVDAPLLRVRKLLALPTGDEAPKTTLYVEVLAAPTFSAGTELADHSIALVVGDAGSGLDEQLARAAARAVFPAALSGAHVKQLAEVHAAVAATTAGAEAAGGDAHQWLAENFVEAAVARSSLAAGAALLDAAYRHGHVLVRDAARVLDGAAKRKPGVSLADYLRAEAGKLDARHASAEFFKALPR